MARRIEPRHEVADAALACGDKDAWRQALGFPTSEPPTRSTGIENGEHTPTPWAFTLSETSPGTPFAHIMSEEAGDIAYLTLRDVPANAAFIVRAVNSHDALVSLFNDVSGCWSAFEASLRESMSNTNYQVIADKITAVKAVKDADSA